MKDRDTLLLNRLSISEGLSSAPPRRRIACISGEVEIAKENTRRSCSSVDASSEGVASKK